MPKLIYRCPGCDNEIREIEEVIIDATVSSVIIADSEDEYLIYEVGPEIYDGEIDRYQCKECGRVITFSNGVIITLPETLIQFLKEQPYNQEDKCP